MNSFNHSSFGAVYGWMKANQPGIRADAADGAMTSCDAAEPANTGATLYLPATGETNSCEGVTLTGAAPRNGGETTHFEIAGNAITQAK